LLEAERHHSTTDDVPAKERAAWREVEQRRSALGVAGERVREVTDRKSLEICKRFRAEHEQYLRELLKTLEATADVTGPGLPAAIIPLDCRSRVRNDDSTKDRLVNGTDEADYRYELKQSLSQIQLHCFTKGPD